MYATDVLSRSILRHIDKSLIIEYKNATKLDNIGLFINWYKSLDTFVLKEMYEITKNEKITIFTYINHCRNNV